MSRHQPLTTGGALGAGRRNTHQKRRHLLQRPPTTVRRNRRWHLRSSPNVRASAPVPVGEECIRRRGCRSACAEPSCPASSQGRGLNPKHECRLDLGNEATVVVPLVDTVAHCGVHALEEAQGELAHATPVGQHERRNAVNLIRSLCLILVDLTPLGLISNAVKQSPLRPSTSKRAWSY